MRTKLQFYLLSFAMIVQFSAEAQNDASWFMRWMEFKENHVPNECQMSVCAVKVQDNEVLFEDRAEENFIPASTIKVITCATALEMLGSEFVWNTSCYFRKKEDSLNLHINCSGDPSFGSRVFADGNTPEKVVSTLVDAILAEGTKGVWQGNVVLHPNQFQRAWLPGSTAWEDVANYYGGAAGAFQFLDNEYTVSFSSGNVGEKAGFKRTIPDLPNLVFVNNVRASSSNKDQAYIYGLPESKERFLQGEIPHSRSNFTIRGGLPSGLLLLESLLRDALREEGVQWSGKARWQSNVFSPSEKDRTLNFVSPPLSQIVQHTLQKSDNLYANALLITLGAKKRGEGSFSAGTNVLLEYVQKAIHPNENKLRIHDGSGLSRGNGVSARSLALVLSAASNSNKQILMKGMRTSKQDVNLHYKSGYLDGVRCYAGFYDDDGELFAFAIMANGVSGSSRALATRMQTFMSECLRLP